MIRPTLIALLASTALATTGSAPPARDDGGIVAWLQSFDQAFVSKDRDGLASFYHPDVAIFEGGCVNNGWVDYRDHHIGPEMKAFKNLQLGHTDVVVHILPGDATAYVTSEYALNALAAGKKVDSGGPETLVLVHSGGAWKIRHSHSTARRRPAPAV